MRRPFCAQGCSLGGAAQTVVRLPLKGKPLARPRLLKGKAPTGRAGDLNGSTVKPWYPHNLPTTKCSIDAKMLQKTRFFH